MPALLEGLEGLLVELVDERDAGGDVEGGDVGVGDLVEVLDDGAQRVAVRGDQDRLAGLDLGDDGALPVGQQAGEDVLEALGGGDGLTGVAGVGVLGKLRTGLDFVYPMLMSTVIFGGSLEFVAVTLLLSPFAPFQALLVTLMIQARHLCRRVARGRTRRTKRTAWASSNSRTDQIL